jgi:hypothetical protein
VSAGAAEKFRQARYPLYDGSQGWIPGVGARAPDVLAPFEPLEISPHVLAAPGGISGDLCDPVPVIVLRVHGDHGVMGGTPSERACPRVQNAIAVGDEFSIAALLLVCGVVPDVVIPFEMLILLLGSGLRRSWSLAHYQELLLS